MKIYQAKSPCCAVKVNHFGLRRRQCSLCKKTWRIRKKKRGRKRKVVNKSLAVQFLEHALPIQKALAAKRKVSKSTVQREIISSLDYFLLHTSWPAIPQESDLIAIADAVVIYKEKKWHTWYFILVRPVEGKEATILPPYHRLGTEVVKGWHEAFSLVHRIVLDRIKAVVCDGHAGLVCEARLQKWPVQRCQFHLIARIQSRRSKWKSSQHFEEGQRIYHLVKLALTTKDEAVLKETLSLVEEIGWRMKSKDLRRTLLGFVNHANDFRTYLYRPDLHLPITSNTAESLIGSIQSVWKRAKGFRSLESLQKWIFAVIKHKKKIVCNGFHQPN